MFCILLEPLMSTWSLTCLIAAMMARKPPFYK
jgi:hypothetical protein